MLLAIFCLRLACGMAGSLLVLAPDQVQPRFYRVQFLTILGLGALAALMRPANAGIWWWLLLIASMMMALAGSIVWSLERLRGRRSLIALTTVSLLAVLALMIPAQPDLLSWTHALTEEATSAALLGTVVTAMLLGHSYLIAPTMTLTPLLRLLAALFVVMVLRMAVAGLDLWIWSGSHSWTNLANATVLWLPVRWGVGFAAPLILGWMAWESAKIRSTQSATGILYVVVIFCFLGELTGQLLGGPAGPPAPAE